MTGYIYLMQGNGLKIGVSKKPKVRVKQVRRTTRGGAALLCSLWFVFPYFFEGVLHALFDFAHAPKNKGSGKTEWFRIHFRSSVFVFFASYFALASLTTLSSPDLFLWSIASALIVTLLLPLYAFAVLFLLFLAEKAAVLYCFYMIVKKIYTFFTFY